MDDKPSFKYIPNFVKNWQEFYNFCQESLKESKDKCYELAGNPGPVVLSYQVAQNEKDENMIRNSSIEIMNVPDILKKMIRMIEEYNLLDGTVVFQISINHYVDSSCYSLSPHKDQKGKQVIILSFGSAVCLDFYYHPSNKYCIMLGPGEFPDKPVGKVLLENGSLLLFKGDTFTSKCVFFCTLFCV